MPIKKIKLPDGSIVDINDSRIHIYRTLTGTAADTVSPYSHAKWDVTDSTITEYVDGMIVCLKVPVAGHNTYGTGLQINNLGYKPVVYNVNTAISTQYSVGSVIWCVYNATQTASLYINSTVVTVTGCWQVQHSDARGSLSSLTDTTISSPTDNQILIYDNITGTWINGNIPTEILVVSFTNISENSYSSTVTIDTIIAALDASKLVIGKLTLSGTNILFVVKEYSSSSTEKYVKFVSFNAFKVNVIDSIATYASDMWTYGFWELKTDVFGLDNLKDVSLSGASFGNVLTFSANGWVPAAVPTELPSQINNNGKFLTTDGSTVSWAPISTGLTNYDFTELSTPTITSGATSIKFAENQRNCVEFSTNADISVAIVSNNKADNYMWITNSHSTDDIDLTFSSISFGATTINDVVGTNSIPTIQAGETLEIGIYVTNTKARITSRIL